MEHLGAEREGFGLLYQLLVGGVGLYPHRNGTLLGINLCIQLGISDQVYDPPLCFLRGHVELFSQHANGDALVDATKSLKDHHARILNEIIQTSNQEEIIDQDCFAVTQLLLGSVKIKVDVKILDEAGDGILVSVGLFLDDLDKILHDIPPGALVSDDSSGEISEDPGTCCLDSIEIGLLVKEQTDNEVSALWMVEEDEQTPVNEPCALLERLEVTTEGAFVNEGLKSVKVLQRGVPVLHEDLSCELSPHAVQVVLVGRLDQDAVEVEILTCTGVVSTLVLELSEVVADVDHLRLEVKSLHQKIKKLLGVS